MFMKDWVEKLDAFLRFNEKDVLSHLGQATHEMAIALAENEFEKFRIIRDKVIESDFDKVLKRNGLTGNKDI